jgi:hypothetical protein
MLGPKVGGHGKTGNVTILGSAALIGENEGDLSYLIIAHLIDQGEYVVSYVTEDAVKANGDIEWWVSGQYFVNAARAWALFTDRIMDHATDGEYSTVVRDR